MKKFIFCLILSIIVCTSCSYDKTVIKNSANFSTHDDNISKSGEYKNTFSKCYDNNNGTKSLFIFSSPIAYEEKKA